MQYKAMSLNRNTSGSLGERETLWEHEPIGECFHSFFEFTHNSSSTDKTEGSLNFICLCLRGVRPRRNAASMKIINKVSGRALITS